MLSDIIFLLHLT